MLVLTTARAIRHAADACAKDVPVPLLERYAALIETEPIAWLFILQPGDRAEQLAEFRGRPFEGWEFILEEGGWYEAVFVLGDDGFGHVVLIPDSEAIDPALLALCRSYAS